MALQWDRSLAVGVKLIDEQHQELFRRVNTLLESMLKNQGKGEIEKLIGFLAQYVVDHFAAEEKMMTQYRYPDLAKHRQAHADFVKRFGELKAAFDKDGATPTVTIELNRFVGGWLREHIGRTDTALGKFLHQVNATEAHA
ncbi:MAG: bacteriohemerythrin [Anaeromyxobacteraceae bacterium]